MKLRKICAVVGLLALIGAPSLYCLVYGPMPSASANECCHQMKAQCGQMSSPQSCCQSPVRKGTAQPYLAAIHFQPAFQTVVANGAAAMPALSCPTNSVSRAARFDSPPLALPGACAVLRI